MGRRIEGASAKVMNQSLSGWVSLRHPTDLMGLQKPAGPFLNEWTHRVQCQTERGAYGLLTIPTSEKQRRSPTCVECFRF